MATLQDFISEARNHLMTEEPDRLNVLRSGVAANATTITLDREVIGIATGATLCIDLECYHVVSDPTTTTPGSNIEVIPGVRGSASAAHTAGALVYVNPEFSDFRIAQQLNHCLTSLEGHGMFWVNSLDFDFLPAQAGYDLDADDFIDIWRVSYDIPGPTNAWPVLSQTDFHLDNAADITEFPSGRQLVLRSGGYPGNPVKVAYRARLLPFPLTPFTPAILTADVEATTHLRPSAFDIPPLGAAIRCMFGGEVKRTFLKRQPEPRRQDEVPPGAILGAGRNLISAYYQAIDREVGVLDRLYQPQTG